MKLQPTLALGLLCAGSLLVACSPKPETAGPPAAAPGSFATGATRVEAFAGGPVLVRVPQATDNRPGTLLGNDNGAHNEKPAYRVRIPYKLAVGETEVTFSQWDQCVADKGCDHKPGDNGWGRGVRPVVNVNWFDVQKYLLWANRKAGLDPTSPNRLRLLTEAEWEYAGRAGSDAEFSVGPDKSSRLTPDAANFDSSTSYKESPVAPPRGQTVPVRGFQPNAFGLYDMHGNVWEWVQDCYDAREHDRRAGSKGWTGTDTSADSPDCPRILRGGSWNVSPYVTRLTARGYSTANFRNIDFGFRIAQTLP